MDTFDKGFGFPDMQWTVEQLEWRLNFMSKMIEGTLEENTTVINEKPINKPSDEDLMRELTSTKLLVRQSDFIQAAMAFSKAKNAFAEESSSRGRFQWTSGICQWTDDVNSMHEKKHFDILTCSNSDRVWTMLVIFHCYIDEYADVIKLAVGTIINGVTVLLPVARFDEKVDTHMIDKRLSVELTTLIQLSH